MSCDTENQKDKATSLCNLIKDIEVLKPNLANRLNEEIHTKRPVLEKIGILRHQGCAHRWKGKTQEEVYAEAALQLAMMKEAVDLARLVICELAGEVGGNRRQTLEGQSLSETTLQSISRDASQVMRALA
jgi:hypothetical protein